MEGMVGTHINAGRGILAAECRECRARHTRCGMRRAIPGVVVGTILGHWISFLVVFVDPSDSFFFYSPVHLSYLITEEGEHRGNRKKKKKKKKRMWDFYRILAIAPKGLIRAIRAL